MLARSRTITMTGLTIAIIALIISLVRFSEHKSGTGWGLAAVLIAVSTATLAGRARNRESAETRGDDDPSSEGVRR